MIIYNISIELLFPDKLLETAVEGNTNGPFSIATALRYREDRDSFSWIAPFYPWSVF